MTTYAIIGGTGLITPETMLLMEHAGAVTLRDRLKTHGDADATGIAAEVLLAYHSASGTASPASPKHRACGPGLRTAGPFT